ncbi:hypothetical protein [Neorhizobium sp. DT-125]|uniref:hypothetical protein n=1 Tax=Neorhizobium sp. DT-125 TaxID=3396163 RepID=UPI003F1BDA80
MPISFSLFDAYVISVVSVWPMAMIVAGVALIAAFRFLKSRVWRLLAVLVAALCLYPVIYWAPAV